MVTPPLGSRVRVSTGPQIWNQICSNCAHCTMHRNQIPGSNSTCSNILVSLIGLVIGLAALTLFGRLGPVVGLPILCLLVFIFRRSSGTRSQEGTRGTGATRAARAARAARALLRSPEVAKVKLPVTIVRLQELSQGKSEATATGSTGVRWSKVTLFWKAVMILNSACWGSTFIGTKSGIDALKAADVRNPGAVFGFLRFALAAFPLLPWLGRSSSLESAAMSFLVGLIWGTSYACTFVSYTLGTTGAKAAFITSLQSVVVAACTSIVAGRLQLGTCAQFVLPFCVVSCEDRVYMGIWMVYDLYRPRSLPKCDFTWFYDASHRLMLAKPC